MRVWSMFRRRRGPDRHSGVLRRDLTAVVAGAVAVSLVIGSVAVGAGGQPADRDPIPIPIGRWVHLEMYLKASTGSDGRVTLWQDGREIIDFTGVTERHGSIRRYRSVNNYG